MITRARRPTIISPTGHIRSYSFGPFLGLIIAGCLLSFVAGYINTICLVGSFQTSISAATGTTSKMTIDLAKGNLRVTLNFFLLIFSFVLGNFISGALVGGSSFRVHRSYGLVLLLESFALASGYLLEKNTLKLIGSSVSLQMAAYFVSLACGLQNGLCTTFSGAVIRTTHVTGILTDIGLVLGQAAFHPRTRKHLWKLKVLFPLYVGFCCGGLTGWFAYRILRAQAILVPCGVLGILGIAHLCYCKIILMYSNREINLKHWKRNKPSRILVPTEENEINAGNNNLEKPMNAIDDSHSENEIEKIPINPDPTDLQIVSVHEPKN